MVGLTSQTVIPRWDMGIISNTGELYFDLSSDISKKNLIPFHTLYQYFFELNANVDDWGSISLLNISANMLLFSPKGFFVPLIWERWVSFKKIFLLGLSVTCIAEVFQFFVAQILTM
ncbi:VanZ family protein [Peribacillus sp. TH27]|uniref:VanZ family protein n=1 Tax=Peribacillus sp. TH27 TaxID=2798484 RepID=UPI00406D31E1